MLPAGVPVPAGQAPRTPALAGVAKDFHQSLPASLNFRKFLHEGASRDHKTRILIPSKITSFLVGPETSSVHLLLVLGDQSCPSACVRRGRKRGHARPYRARHRPCHHEVADGICSTVRGGLPAGKAAWRTPPRRLTARYGLEARKTQQECREGLFTGARTPRFHAYTHVFNGK